MEHMPDYVLFHYGSYETKFIKKMGSEYGGNAELLEKIRSRSFNVLSSIYGRVYFPTYSNDLKSIASILGFKWSDQKASGVMSIFWRQQWEESNDQSWKEKIVTYNHEDCLALRTVEREVRRIGLNTANTTVCLTKNIDEIKPDKHHSIFKKNDFFFPELDKINACAYFDYQQSRVYCRTNIAVKRRLKKIKGHIRSYYKANKIISIDRLLNCPYCGARKPRKYGNYSRIVRDMKLFDGGIRRWVVQYTYKRYSCKACHKTFFPDTWSIAPNKYGKTLVSWTVNQNIARLQSYRIISEELREIFGFHFRPNLPFIFKQDAAHNCNCAYQSLIESVRSGSLIHVDETNVNIVGISGYVWAFANMDTVFYLFQKTREGHILKEILNGFKGVLLSDFYSAYDSIPCPQQKCLIHLIRDINEDLLKHPFDEELKEVGKDFTMLLAPIVNTIDKYGLKQIHLNKHKHEVSRFIRKIEKAPLTSEIAMNFQRRIMKYRDKLFTFLDYDGVPWNNNNAEHAIKRFAQLRRVIGGSSTAKGIQEYLVLLSICETLRLRNASFLRFLMSGATDIDEYLKPQSKKAA